MEDYDAILISLLAETASTYVDLRTAQQRLAYAKSNVKIQEGGLKFAEVRFQATAVSKLDVTQGENIVANTQQLIPIYENQIRVANNALCVLLGVPIRDLTPELGESADSDTACRCRRWRPGQPVAAATRRSGSRATGGGAKCCDWRGDSGPASAFLDRRIDLAASRSV